MKWKTATMALSFTNRHLCIGRKPHIKSTSKTKNLEVELSTKATDSILSVAEMEDHLRDAGSDMGIYMSHITTLSKKKYPGNRHWHFKQSPRETGCLDVTYWPDGDLMWISIRLSEPEWVHEAGHELKVKMEEKLATLKE